MSLTFFGCPPSHLSAYESRRRALTWNKTPAAGKKKMHVSICHFSKWWLVFVSHLAGNMRTRICSSSPLPPLYPFGWVWGGLHWRQTRVCWLPPYPTWGWIAHPLLPVPPCYLATRSAWTRSWGNYDFSFVRQAATFFPLWCCQKAVLSGRWAGWGRGTGGPGAAQTGSNTQGLSPLGCCSPP